MSTLLVTIFAEFKGISTVLLILEIIGVITGLLSVLLAARENTLSFASAIVSTNIYTYIYWQDSLWGNMLIHAYYTVTSIYDWFLWSKKKNQPILTVSHAKRQDYVLAVSLFVVVVCFIKFLYNYYPNIISSNQDILLDIITPAIFCVAMIFTAYKKIESWILWIIGDILVIPLYFNSKLYFTSIVYAVYIIIGIGAWFEWKKHLIQKL